MEQTFTTTTKILKIAQVTEIIAAIIFAKGTFNLILFLNLKNALRKVNNDIWNDSKTTEAQLSCNIKIGLVFDGQKWCERGVVEDRYLS